MLHLPFNILFILGSVFNLFYLGQAGRLTEAERLLKTMRKSKCPRGSAAYVTLMEAYGREEEPEEAERIFLLMQVDGKGLTQLPLISTCFKYLEDRMSCVGSNIHDYVYLGSPKIVVV